MVTVAKTTCKAMQGYMPMTKNWYAMLACTVFVFLSL
jgi:hypothetical protein